MALTGRFGGMDPVYGLTAAFAFAQGPGQAVTGDAARQYGEEQQKGTLEAGKLADLVVLSADPTAVETNDLREVTVEATYKRGTRVFAR